MSVKIHFKPHAEAVDHAEVLSDDATLTAEGEIIYRRFSKAMEGRKFTPGAFLLALQALAGSVLDATREIDDQDRVHSYEVLMCLLMARTFATKAEIAEEVLKTPPLQTIEVH